MNATEIMLQSFELVSFNAEQIKQETETFEAHFSIKYSMSGESTFSTSFSLSINGEGTEDSFFNITVNGVFTKSGFEDTIEGKHTAACMLYPYLRNLALPILKALGQDGLEFPLSVPLSVVAMSEAAAKNT